MRRATRAPRRPIRRFCALRRHSHFHARLVACRAPIAQRGRAMRFRRPMTSVRTRFLYSCDTIGCVSCAHTRHTDVDLAAQMRRSGVPPPAALMGSGSTTLAAYDTVPPGRSLGSFLLLFVAHKRRATVVSEPASLYVTPQLSAAPTDNTYGEVGQPAELIPRQAGHVPPFGGVVPQGVRLCCLFVLSRTHMY